MKFKGTNFTTITQLVYAMKDVHMDSFFENISVFNPNHLNGCLLLSFTFKHNDNSLHINNLQRSFDIFEYIRTAFASEHDVAQWNNHH